MIVCCLLTDNKTNMENMTTEQWTQRCEENSKRIFAHRKNVLHSEDIYSKQIIDVVGRFIIRTPSDGWWTNVEMKENATVGDTFLCRRDEIVLDDRRVTVEYGSTLTEKGWTRQSVAFLSDETSPYPFAKDCFSDGYRFKL